MEAEQIEAIKNIEESIERVEGDNKIPENKKEMLLGILKEMHLRVSQDQLTIIDLGVLAGLLIEVYKVSAIPNNPGFRLGGYPRSGNEEEFIIPREKLGL